MSGASEMLRKKISEAIQREVYVPDVLIAINEVDVSPDLQNATVYVSVLPDKFNGTALEKLRKANASISKYLNKTTRLRYVPRFNWVIDSRSRDAFEMEDFINMANMEAETEEDTKETN